MSQEVDGTAEHETRTFTSTSQPIALRCMEIWGGCEPAAQTVQLPGLNGWILSRPHLGAPRGGDVYYVSLCGGGLITRIVLADVSGHGEKVAKIALALRDAVRRNINRKSQNRLVAELNRAFAEIDQAGDFATAVVATYLAHHDRLTLHNAGHPRPLWFRADRHRWQFLGEPALQDTPGNLPLGLDEATAYHSIEVDLAPGDLIIFYTDALSEAKTQDGGLLGEQGLLDVAQGLIASDPTSLGTRLLAAVERTNGGPLSDDDLTLLVFHHHAGPPRRPSVSEKLDIYAKVFGIRSV